MKKKKSKRKIQGNLLHIQIIKKNNLVVWTAACCVEPVCLLLGRMGKASSGTAWFLKWKKSLKAISNLPHILTEKFTKDGLILKDAIEVFQTGNPNWPIHFKEYRYYRQCILGKFVCIAGRY